MLLVLALSSVAACQNADSPTPAASEAGATSTPVASGAGATPTPNVSEGRATPTPVVSEAGATPTPVVSGAGATPTPVVSGAGATPIPAVSANEEVLDDSPDQSSPYLQLLSVIPDSPEIRSGIFLDDYTLLRELFKGLLPGPGEDDGTVKNLLQDRASHFAGFYESVGRGNTFGTESFLGPLGQHVQFAMNAHEYLALDLRNVEQTIWTWSPERFGHLDVARGSFDPGATEAALGLCGDCPPPKIQDRNGVPFYSWGGDNEAGVAPKFSPPVFDRLGRGGQLAVLNNFVFRTSTTPGMEALIDAHSNTARSLADAEEFVLLAQGLEQVRPYSALLSAETFSVDDLVEFRLGPDASEDERAKLASALSAPQPLRPYDAYAMGSGLDETGRYLGLVLAHSESAHAAENVDILHRRIEEGSLYTGEPWSDFIESASINAEGRLLLAKLRGPIVESWLNSIFIRETPLVHE